MTFGEVIPSEYVWKWCISCPLLPRSLLCCSIQSPSMWPFDKFDLSRCLNRSNFYPQKPFMMALWICPQRFSQSLLLFHTLALHSNSLYSSHSLCYFKKVVSFLFLVLAIFRRNIIFPEECTLVSLWHWRFCCQLLLALIMHKYCCKLLLASSADFASTFLLAQIIMLSWKRVFHEFISRIWYLPAVKKWVNAI